MPKRSGPAFLYLTTTGWKSGKPHEIEIWFTELDGRYYLISETGKQAHWVQNLRREPRVTFRVGRRTFRGMGSDRRCRGRAGAAGSGAAAVN